MDILTLIGRSATLFDKDLLAFDDLIRDIVSNGRFLVIGGAGSIGRSVSKEIFKRNPRVLHVVDISENKAISARLHWIVEL